ncbi:uncharacterized protein RHO25_001585 [Cercospora beticola]|uniref:Uncharacterized protein n=2 Tax=Cercospora beticola TaxID=122368 RepID=A0ABZ0NBS0_CERBT|nr:hypothetical protein RHO25_001585 [Cercospora beticola]
MYSSTPTTMDLRGQAAAWTPQHESATQYLAAGRRQFPSEAPNNQTLGMAQTTSLCANQGHPYSTNGFAPAFPSPPASQHESTAPQHAINLQQDLVNHLRDDRDRLVNDKERLVSEKNALLDEKRLLVEDRERAVKATDELLSSKTRLWQDYYNDVKSRDEEIAKLKEGHTSLERELGVLKKQNRRLARELDEFMEKDENGVGPEDDLQSKGEIKFESGLEAEPVPKARKQARTSSWLEGITQPEQAMTESRKQMEELFGGRHSDTAVNDCDTAGEPPTKRTRFCAPDMVHENHEKGDTSPRHVQSPCVRPSLGQTCDLISDPPTTEQQGAAELVGNPALLAPLPQLRLLEAAPQDPHDATGLSESLRKLQNNYLGPMAFTIRPAIRHNIAIKGYGQLQELNIIVLDSISETMSMLQQKVQQGKRPKSPRFKSTQGCCWSWTHSSSHCLWTTDHPRLFACRSCFQAQRACLLWQGDGVWDILPLPPKVRKQNAAHTDHEYCIFGQRVSWGDFGEFAPVWEPSNRKETTTQSTVTSQT